MDIDQKSENDIYIVSVKGKLMSSADVEELTHHFRYLRDKKVTRVVLNLEGLDWTGSLGLGGLISCVTTMRNAGGDVHLCNLNKKMHSVLAITRLDEVFRIFDSVDQALQGFTAEVN